MKKKQKNNTVLFLCLQKNDMKHRNKGSESLQQIERNSILHSVFLFLCYPFVRSLKDIHTSLTNTNKHIKYNKKFNYLDNTHSYIHNIHYISKGLNVHCQSGEITNSIQILQVYQRI